MSFPRYPKYKASGVEWLGEVPVHWGVTQLKRVVNPERQITYGIVQAGPHIPDGVPYIRPADMTDEQGILAPDEVMRTSPEIASAYSRSTIRTGDIVCSIGPSFGKAMITPTWLDGANLTQGTARIAVQPPHDVKYLFWTLRSPVSVAQWESSVGGATFRALNLGPLAETTILVPDETEQTMIAAFVDRETSKIDGLVGEQRRLIELLNEKRQAVISHAVTKGLNPQATLKPSGIEWLGDVPEHWVVGKLGYVFAEPPCYGVLVPDFDPDGIPMLRINDMTGNRINRDQLVTISRELSDQYARSIVQTGDLIISVVGQLGVTSVVDDDLAGVNLSRNVARVQFGERMHSDFARWLFTSTLFQHYTDLVCVGTAQRLLNMSALTAFIAACPPTAEQRNITKFLERETSKIDTLTAEAQRGIELLQERRTALISAAVTGKIDVRELVESEAA